MTKCKWMLVVSAFVLVNFHRSLPVVMLANQTDNRLKLQLIVEMVILYSDYITKKSPHDACRLDTAGNHAAMWFSRCI